MLHFLDLAKTMCHVIACRYGVSGSIRVIGLLVTLFGNSRLCWVNPPSWGTALDLHNSKNSTKSSIPLSENAHNDTSDDGEYDEHVLTKELRSCHGVMSAHSVLRRSLWETGTREPGWRATESKGLPPPIALVALNVEHII